MSKYEAYIRNPANSSVTRMVIQADSYTDAKYIFESQYGANNVNNVSIVLYE